VLPTNTKREIELFCNFCQDAKFIYDEYRVLFESGEFRLKLLEEVAHNFFYDIQGVLIERVYLDVCKLTDPPRHRKDDNLTVSYILELINEKDRQRLGLDDLSKKLHSFREPMKKARNKVIAHLDRKTVLSGGPVGAFVKGEDEIFWDNLQKFVDKIYGHCFNEACPLDVTALNGAEALVDALKKAVHYDDCYDECLNNMPQRLTDRREMRFKDA
jgi:hypothetical protein